MEDFSHTRSHIYGVQQQHSQNKIISKGMYYFRRKSPLILREYQLLPHIYQRGFSEGEEMDYQG